MAGTQTADAVTQIHSVCALGALYGAMTDREGHSITLLKAYHLGPGLHAGASCSVSTNSPPVKSLPGSDRRKAT